MTRKCFFIEQSVNPGDESITLDPRTSHHLENVLRARPGDCLELRDGGGRGWRGEIEGIADGLVRVRLQESQELGSESPLELTLALALSRPDRMELVLREATEIGVSRFAAFRARRSQYGLSGDQAEKRKARWTKIAREAMCQCGRARLPEIDLFSGLDEFMAEMDAWGSGRGPGLRILAWEAEGRKGLMDLWSTSPECRRVLAVVGPEGGWTQDEVDRFRAADFHSVRLGPRILRLETAAIAFLSSAQLLWGDLGE